MSLRSDFIQYAECWIGRWYKWGGDDPSGFDCSGYAIECLKAFDKFPRKQDTTADGLKAMFRSKEVHIPTTGCLVFWLDRNRKAYHVEIALNSWQSLGASGGGSKTKTVDDAILQNAFIKIRPISSRQPSGSWMFVDPWLDEYPIEGG